MSESLFLAYKTIEDKNYLKVAESSLRFLMNKTFQKSTFIPIGQKGWYMKGKERAYFDQQPEDAASTTQTMLAAYKITKNQTLTGYTHFYPDLGDGGTFRNESAVHWKMTLDPTKGMSLKLGLENEYESQVGPGTKHNDIKYYGALVHDF